MILEVNDELKAICEKIEIENLSLEDWRETESGDEFQSEHFCGGYDADEDAFCFSYYDANKVEWWFQITLDEVHRIQRKELINVEAREAQ